MGAFQAGGILVKSWPAGLLLTALLVGSAAAAEGPELEGWAYAGDFQQYLAGLLLLLSIATVIFVSMAQVSISR